MKKYLVVFVLIIAAAFIFSQVGSVLAQNKNQSAGPNASSNAQNSNKNASTTGQANSEEHRSAVADFVQSLLQVADREQGGIGSQVRIIARQQNDSASISAQAMEKIEKRSKFKTFLIGSDYNNLGELRRELVHSRNRIEQLNRLMEQVQNEGDKTELRNEIQQLEQEQTRIENFIKEQESKVSLFGWLVKLLLNN